MISKSQQQYINYVYVAGSAIAHSAVTRSILKGTLEPARTFKCVDCGNDASCYDHRDYNYPLQVEPVCRRCNCLRGAAIPKTWNSYEEFLFYIASRKAIKWFQKWHGLDIAAHCLPRIEAATNGLVRCEDLRPDVQWAVLRNTTTHQEAA